MRSVDPQPHSGCPQRPPARHYQAVAGNSRRQGPRGPRLAARGQVRWLLRRRSFASPPTRAPHRRRARFPPERMRDGARGDCVEAPIRPLPGRTDQQLAQGQVRAPGGVHRGRLYRPVRHARRLRLSYSGTTTRSAPFISRARSVPASTPRRCSRSEAPRRPPEPGAAGQEAAGDDRRPDVALGRAQLGGRGTICRMDQRWLAATSHLPRAAEGQDGARGRARTRQGQVARARRGAGHPYSATTAARRHVGESAEAIPDEGGGWS